MSLREAKRVSTRAALEQAAWLLAAARPWSEITIDDITAGAGVARRTFFNYFESKEELLNKLKTLMQKKKDADGDPVDEEDGDEEDEEE